MTPLLGLLGRPDLRFVGRRFCSLRKARRSLLFSGGGAGVGSLFLGAWNRNRPTEWRILRTFFHECLMYGWKPRSGCSNFLSHFWDVRSAG